MTLPNGTSDAQNAWTRLDLGERRAKAIPLYLWTIVVTSTVCGLMWLVVPWSVAGATGVLSLSFVFALITQLVRAPQAVSVRSILKAFFFVWCVLAVGVIVVFAAAALIAGG
jgi:hypothetical protein